MTQEVVSSNSSTIQECCMTEDEEQHFKEGESC